MWKKRLVKDVVRRLEELTKDELWRRVGRDRTLRER